MKNKKNMVMIAVILVVLVIIGFIVINANKNKVNKNSNVAPTEAESIVPTTDASTIATLTTSNSGKEVTLSIEGIPNDTTTIDYELSYSTKQQGFQGVIGTISPDSNEKTYEKKITLGTCSSGKCVYHEVVGAIKTTLKFSGSYGEKILEKEFTL